MFGNYDTVDDDSPFLEASSKTSESYLPYDTNSYTFEEREVEEEQILSEEAQFLSDKAISRGKLKVKISSEPPQWNAMFQSCLEKEDGFDKFNELRVLTSDFIYCAESYGKIIISEKCLPNEKKTIKPIEIGGIAGGQVCFFYF